MYAIICSVPVYCAGRVGVISTVAWLVAEAASKKCIDGFKTKEQNRSKDTLDKGNLGPTSKYFVIL